MNLKEITLITALLINIGMVSCSSAQTSNWQREWPRTDFSRASIDLSEIMSGGPPKDGIPPVDRPSFVSFSDADKWLKPHEPVISIEIKDEAKAYPIQIMTWHEIVNDKIGGTPVTITFCPLCNSSIAFDRRLEFEGESYLLDFGTSGKLRKSDLVMYDRQTETWWQQFVGEAIVGKLNGATLKMLPSNLISYASFKASYPDGKVLSRKTGFRRDYGRNPYSGYDDIRNSPFLFRGPIDSRLPAMERIINVTIKGVNKIYPFSKVRKEKVVNDRIGDTGVVLFHLSGTVSALDSPFIATSRDIGAITVFRSFLDGKELTFKRDGELFLDDQTGTRWTITGKAVDGPLAGKKLTPIVHGNHFAFAWLAFKPDSIIYGQE